MIDRDGEGQSHEKGEQRQKKPGAVAGNTGFHQIVKNKVVGQAVKQVDKKYIAADRIDGPLQMAADGRAKAGDQQVNPNTQENHGRVKGVNGRILPGEPDLLN